MKINHTRLAAMVALMATLAMAATALAVATPSLQDAPGVRQVGPVAQTGIPADIQSAIEAPDRPAADKQLDAGRKPGQTMVFYGIKPGMQVADLSAGGGYTTELLSRIVGPTGKVYSQNGKVPPRFARMIEAWHKRLARPELKNVVAVQEPFDSPDLLPVKPGTLDTVLINMNYHDLVGAGVDMNKMNATIYKDLKPGGIYGIIDNSAAPGTGAADVKTLHRIGENFVIRQVEKSGFKLVAASSALRNPKDDRTWFIFKHRGQQDRFMLKFKKPQ
jgi:predicted methyltransferase